MKVEATKSSDLASPVCLTTCVFFLLGSYLLGATAFGGEQVNRENPRAEIETAKFPFLRSSTNRNGSKETMLDGNFHALPYSVKDSLRETARTFRGDGQIRRNEPRPNESNDSPDFPIEMKRNPKLSRRRKQVDGKRRGPKAILKSKDVQKDEGTSGTGSTPEQNSIPEECVLSRKEKPGFQRMPSKEQDHSVGGGATKKRKSHAKNRKRRSPAWMMNTHMVLCETGLIPNCHPNNGSHFGSHEY